MDVVFSVIPVRDVMKSRSASVLNSRYADVSRRDNKSDRNVESSA